MLLNSERYSVQVFLVADAKDFAPPQHVKVQARNGLCLL